MGRQCEAIRVSLAATALTIGIAAGACASRSPPPPTERAATPTGPTIPVVEPKFGPDALGPTFFPPLVPPEPDAMFVCGTNEDCVVIELGCCDHCNGGSLLAVNLASMDAAHDRFRQSDCAGVDCSERGCGWDYEPVCDRGTCARLEQRDLNGIATEVSVVHNRPAPRAMGGTR
jgi:hypothetical protein